MKHSEKPGLLSDLFWFLWVRAPLETSKWVARKIKKAEDSRVQLIWLSGVAVCWLLSLAGFVFAHDVYRLFRLIRIYGVLLYFVFLYGLYFLFFSPGFLFFTYFSKENELEILGKERPAKRKIIRDSDVQKGRKNASASQAYLGSSLWSGKPVYLSEDMRLMHTHVVGSTGSGKTDSVLLTLLRRDIERGHGIIILDAKGDYELLAKIKILANQVNREKDFLFFSLSHPELSNTYNPLLRGNASEIKDKLIGATEWREEFYKKKAEEALLTLLRPMEKILAKGNTQELAITFRTLYDLLTDIGQLRALRQNTDDPGMYRDLGVMERNFGDSNKYLSGLIADLALVAKSEFSKLVDVAQGEIDLLKVYEEKRIVYFSLNTQGYEETAKRFGRLVLQDIKTLSNHIQTQLSEGERHFLAIHIDEFSSFTYQNFIEVLNKGRGARFAFSLYHQSLGDLSARGMSFQQQILENTNIKIMMRQDDPISIEKMAKIGGSKKTLVSTYQTEEGIIGKNYTGVGSIREGQVFRIDPDLVRALGRGEAMVISKYPKLEIDYVKLDYTGAINTKAMLQQIRRERELGNARLGEGKDPIKKDAPKGVVDLVKKYQSR